MRPILVASLLLSPMLLTASAVASQPTTDASSAAKTLPVSTGVVAPKIIDAAYLHIPADAFDATAAAKEEVSLSLSVDEKGRAQNVHVLSSTNPHFDARVVEAVSQSHFAPAKLNNQAIPIDLNLTVVVSH